MREARGLSALLFVTLILWTSGCGDSENTRKELSGTWERNILGEDGSFAGYLTFGPGSTFEFTFNGEAGGHERSAGKYRLSGRDITFEDSSCGVAGRYRFLVKSGALSFIPLGDGCGKRKSVLTGEWKRRNTGEPAPN